MFVPGLNDIGRVESYLREEYNHLKLEFDYVYLLKSQDYAYFKKLFKPKNTYFAFRL